MAMIEPERFEPLLQFEEQSYMEALQLAYHHCWDMLERSASVNYILNNIRGFETMYKANRLLDDMQELFGRFIEKNKHLKQSLVVSRFYESYERQIKIAKQLYEDGDFEKAILIEEKANAVLEKAAKLDGLDKLQSVGFSASDFKLPPIEITSDPKVLKGGDEEE